MNARANCWFSLLWSFFITTAVWSASTLQVSPITCAGEDRLTLRIDASDPASAGLRERRRMEVVITDAYRGVALARATINLRPVANVLQGELTFSAEPGVYAIQGANRNEAVTSRALFFVHGIGKVGAWWLPNNVPLLGLRLRNRWQRPAELLLDASPQGGGFNTLWQEAPTENEMVVGAEIRAALARHGGSIVLNLPVVATTGFSEGEHVVDFRGVVSPTGCLVATPNRERLRQTLERLGSRFAREDSAQQDRANLLALTADSALQAPAACYCKFCSEAFLQWSARLSGLSFVEPPRDPQSVSPVYARHWEDFQFQILPAFVGWLKEKSRLSFPNLGLVASASPTGIDSPSDSFDPPSSVGASANLETRFHPGTDLSQLAESADALVTSVTPADVASNVALLVAAVGRPKSLDDKSDPDRALARPVWARVSTPDQTNRLRIDNLARLEAVFRGATGVVSDLGPLPTVEQMQPLAESNRFLAAHANLFIDARVVSDVGIVFPVIAERLPREGLGREVRRDYVAMMRALVARHWSPRAVWSERGDNLSSAQTPILFVPAVGALSARFVDRLRKYVEGGGRAYLEGLTLYDADGKRVAWPLKELVRVELEPVGGHASELALDDLWVFGNQKDKLPVEQLGVINKINGARVLAKFTDGTPGLVWRRVGLGEVFFTPSRVANSSFATTRYAHYCDAIASAGCTSAVHVKGDNAGEVRCATLRTKTTRLFGVFNYGAAKPVEVTLDAPQRLTYDLRNKRALGSPDDRARLKTHTLQLPAHDWLAIANVDSSEALEKEIKQVRYRLTVK